MKTRFFTKTKEYEGAPKLSDFKIVEEDIDENIEDGGELVYAFMELFDYSLIVAFSVNKMIAK